jgi:hypothetical protein
VGHAPNGHVTGVVRADAFGAVRIREAGAAAPARDRLTHELDTDVASAVEGGAASLDTAGFGGQAGAALPAGADIADALAVCGAGLYGAPAVQGVAARDGAAAERVAEQPGTASFDSQLRTALGGERLARPWAAEASWTAAGKRNHARQDDASQNHVVVSGNAAPIF